MIEFDTPVMPLSDKDGLEQSQLALEPFDVYKNQPGRGLITQLLEKVNCVNVAAVGLSIGSLLGGPLISAATAHGRAKQSGPPVRVIETTTNLRDHLTPRPMTRFSHNPPKGSDVISIDPAVRLQTIDGFGSAMTDSSAWLIHNQLSGPERVKLMEDLFGQHGIKENEIRSPLGSSDFTASENTYSYDDLLPGQIDPNLNNFTIAHDLEYIIPVLKMARDINPRVSDIATEWSPPEWFKQNDSMTNSTGIGDNLVTASWAMPALAEYMTDAVNAYKATGFTINALTPQNEPTVARSYSSLDMPESQMADFIPELRSALNQAGLGSVALYGNDLSFNDFSDYAEPLAQTFYGANTLKGLAWHTYFGDPAVMNIMRAMYPEYDELVTEDSPEIRGESTATAIFTAINNGASGVILWNTALNKWGGPVQPPNTGCTGCRPVAYINNGHFKLTSKYYEMGQFSSLVNRGAAKIESSTPAVYGTNPESNFPAVSYGSEGSAGIDDSAFENPDGQKVLVVGNTGETREIGVEESNKSFSYKIPRGATVSFSWK